MCCKNNSIINIPKGSDGVGVISTDYNNETGVVTFTYSDGSTFSTEDLRGAPGADGTNGYGDWTEYDVSNVLLRQGASPSSTQISTTTGKLLYQTTSDGIRLKFNVNFPSPSTGSTGAGGPILEVYVNLFPLLTSLNRTLAIDNSGLSTGFNGQRVNGSFQTLHSDTVAVDSAIAGIVDSSSITFQSLSNYSESTTYASCTLYFESVVKTINS